MTSFLGFRIAAGRGMMTTPLVRVSEDTPSDETTPGEPLLTRHSPSAALTVSYVIGDACLVSNVVLVWFVVCFASQNSLEVAVAAARIAMAAAFV